MHSRFVSITAIAVISLAPISWQTDSRAAVWSGGQEVLIECPSWEWEPSQIPGVLYEICFDDIEHCSEADIGDSVCIPSLGYHDVWVTAIDYQGNEPIYYDGDIVAIERVTSADFSGNGSVGFSDLSFFSNSYGALGENPADLDGDGVVGIQDFGKFSQAFGKCVNPSGTVYEPC